MNTHQGQNNRHRKKQQKTQFAYLLITILTSISLTGVGLFWSEKLSQEQLQTTITVVSKVLLPCIRLLIE
ncbi:MAG: hypothetical protein F6K10_18060 [Moorea sp. SIO2B7]|nr:hypothetical protein [Moorena sp. SIO2B7]